MGIVKVLTIIGMVIASWLLVIGAIYAIKTLGITSLFGLVGTKQ
jgi:hypothetical protein